MIVGDKSIKIRVELDRDLRRQFAAVFGILGITLLSGSLILMTNFVAADDVIDVITVNVSAYCSMSSTASPYTVLIAGGQVNNDVGSTALTATCNDTGGYAIYAIGYSENTEGNTAMVAASPLTSTYNIATGTATSGSASNWAMKMTAGDDSATIESAFSSFHNIPSTFTKVASKSSGTSLSNTIIANSKYQIYIANGQAAGSYTGKVKYTLVHPSTQDCPDGYTLEGGVCTAPSLTSITTMQAMTTSICTNAAVGDTKQLKDTRDNKYYWVTKLADNNCWMTQNLDLDLSSSVTLTPSDTNIESNWTPSTGTYTTNRTNWAIGDNGATHPYSFDGGDAYLPDGVLSSNCTNKDMTTCSGVGTLSLTDTAAVLNNANAHYHVGNYYTWTAAIASNDSSSYTTQYENAPSSICPKGWKLPSGFGGSSSVNGDFTNLLNDYNIETGNGYSDSELLSTPLYFVRAGYVGSSGSLTSVGSEGEYHSSTVKSNIRDYSLVLTSDYVHSDTFTSRNAGRFIRCLAK